jgi:hypothetical protein
MSGRWFWLCSTACLFIYDCGNTSRFAPRKPDPTKGTVTGTVICTDTGKPARFAMVTLLPDPRAPKTDPAPSEETTETGLDGKFKIEAVTPGEYFAFATLAGYLDPEYGIDFDRMDAQKDESTLNREVVDQWKEHMVEIGVSVQQTTDFSIQIERGAEIAGTVTYDDGSPAIGIRFAFYRRNEKGGWSGVGLTSPGGFALPETSDSRGHFEVTNLAAGEYTACSVVPGDSQESSPQMCLGNVFRKRDARTISVSAGEAANGADMVIPLKAIHSISGSLNTVTASAPPVQAKLRLLYADDREAAMSTGTFSDGSFLFPFVPEGNFILQVTDASYTEPAPETGSAESAGKAAPKVHSLANREVSVPVEGDVSDLAIQLVETPLNKQVQR